MSDPCLNYYVSRGTTTQRLAFTPTPATPAAGPSPGYLWWDTTLQEEFAYDFLSSAWVSTAGSGGAGPPFLLLTADPISPVDDTWWVVRTGTSPTMTVSIKARIAGVTSTIASITQ